MARRDRRIDMAHEVPRAADPSVGEAARRRWIDDLSIRFGAWAFRTVADLPAKIIPLVGKRVCTVLLIVLVLVGSTVVFGATSLALAAIYWILRSPTGTLGAVLGLSWFGGTLGLIAVILLVAYRRVPIFAALVSYAMTGTTRG